ncbi:MAG: hypothetical protein GC154_19150 [bacterium]|nr:hypothetical protein [bacterium]
MQPEFYRPADPHHTIVDSLRDSLRFTTRHCLTTYRGNLCATSTFVDPNAQPAHWHEFGDIEGVGWAANAVGGALLILKYAKFFNDARMSAIGRSILFHALEGGFFHNDGRVTPYREISTDKRYLNYMTDARSEFWFCPGSIAHICLQLIWASDEVENPLRDRLRETAMQTADYLWKHHATTSNGWYPRRCKPDGSPTHLNCYGDPDRQYENSGDGVYLLWLWAELTRRGWRDREKEVRRACAVFRDIGGAFGSINHDTYDDHENAAYSVAFRCLRRAASLLRDPALYEWAVSNCLHGLERFEMTEDRNGVETRGLLYMEDSWDCAYLWENAEAALAYFEAALSTRLRSYEMKGLTILRAAARHHYGELGFLSEGIDWNNHNGQYRNVNGVNIPIHVNEAVYGAVNYTQPFLNNMYIAAPTLFYLERLASRRETGNGSELLDCEENPLVIMSEFQSI